MAKKKIIAPVTLVVRDKSGSKQVLPGQEVSMDAEEADAIIERFGTYQGGTPAPAGDAASAQKDLTIGKLKARIAQLEQENKDLLEQLEGGSDDDDNDGGLES